MRSARHIAGTAWGHISPGRYLQRRCISNKIFIRGLPDTVTKKQVEDCLSCYGIIKEVTLFDFKVIKSSSAIVAFKEINSTFSAIDELHNSLLFGRRISIEFARPPVQPWSPNNPTTQSMTPNVQPPPKQYIPRRSRNTNRRRDEAGRQGALDEPGQSAPVEAPRPDEAAELRV